MTQKTNTRLEPMSPPVAIGGVGGSGTRVVASILDKLGFYMGAELNEAHDNLWFSLLFKRVEILDATDAELELLTRIFVNGMRRECQFSSQQRSQVMTLAANDRSYVSSQLLRRGAQTLLAGGGRRPAPGERWGWKEPNTHVVISRLQKFIPGLKYIHVVRNGLDMSYSANQHQLTLWGRYFLGSLGDAVTPRNSLAFWCEVQRRALDLEESMAGRFLLLNYEHLCCEPARVLGTLLRFVDVVLPAEHVERLAKTVITPATVGRFKSHPLDTFDPADVEFVKSLGFDTSL